MISTVRFTRTQDASMLVEHPEDWSADDLTAAVEARALDIGGAISFWAAKTTRTDIGEIVLDDVSPDDAYAKPFLLTADDVGSTDDAEEEA